MIKNKKGKNMYLIGGFYNNKSINLGSIKAKN